MNLEDHLVRIREGLLRGETWTDEAQVRQGIILPVLDSLGWPIYDTSIVCPEYRLGTGVVDFALCRHDPLIIIEAKRIGGQGEISEQQLIRYAFDAGAQIVILCDGKEWHFFLPAGVGDFNSRRFYKIDLVEREIKDSAERFRRYIQYERICSEEGFRAAQADYKDTTKKKEAERNLPEAWRRLLIDDEQIVELLADKTADLCGYKPDSAQVRNFLDSITELDQARPRESKANRTTQSRPRAIPAPAVQLAESVAMPTKFSYELRGKKYCFETAKDLLVSAIGTLLPTDKLLGEFQVAARGRKRLVVARKREDLFPGAPQLINSAHELPGGWFIDTHNSTHTKAQYLEIACEVAGIQYGKEFIPDLRSSRASSSRSQA